jgi:imidazolonepropionase-like amidohydrolase
VPEALRQASANVKNALAQLEKREPMSDSQYLKDMFANARDNLKKLHGMGATVGVGTDLGGTYCGFFGRFADELEHYVSVGISNFDTLCMATFVNAHILDMQDKIGTIEPGKLADIIAVEGNPLRDIHVMDRVSMVVKGGVFIKAEGIDLS